mmetsp:Transcript_41745/g.107826  ORF Transcript_41745/g.107826 Transcript_41745/m.107826 type:complete len:108 (+) Transcript_41745:286-609(+)
MYLSFLTSLNVYCYYFYLAQFLSCSRAQLVDVEIQSVNITSWVDVFEVQSANITSKQEEMEDGANTGGNLTRNSTTDTGGGSTRYRVSTRLFWSKLHSVQLLEWGNM